MENNIKEKVADIFLEMAEGLESGNFGKKPKIALTGLGSELGEENCFKAALLAAKVGIDVYYIGTLKDESIKTIEVKDDEEGHKKMDELLNKKEIDACVTMHYPFPIGVSTVGRSVTPAFGKEMLIANTTGTASVNRIEGMVKNAIYGIITAKALGNTNPTLGILNVDGARQCEIALNKLKENGYNINFAKSNRSDGGAVMRGNDVLQGTPDIMVMDSLTGNVLTKVLSSFTTGGGYETMGFGYGCGIGKDYDKLVLIVSRASGTPLILNAMLHAKALLKGNIFEVAKEEFKKVEKAGFNQVLESLKPKTTTAETTEIKAPAKEPCTASIQGIEVMDIEDAVKTLWKENIYAESGMGCTGPMVLMSDKNHDKALEILKKAGYIA